jgi:phenylalanyl-tRNA synthetase alpha subunit
MEGTGTELMYRNEAMDATHLAEFFQVEGVVADYDITLGNLVGMFHSLQHPSFSSNKTLTVCVSEVADE